jgi:hypothetical protein
MDVISLLQNKRRCLRRFLEVSEQFLRDATQGDLSGLDNFESRREAAIKTLGMIDTRITELVRAIPLDRRTATLSQAVQGNLDEEAALVQSILTTDNRIMACIEREKERITKELNATRKQHEIAGKFKSFWMPEAGEGLDREA